MKREERTHRLCNPALMSLRDAATFLGVSTWTVRDWTDRELLPHIRINCKLFYRLTSLQRFVDQMEIPATRTLKAVDRRRWQRQQPQQHIQTGAEGAGAQGPRPLSASTPEGGPADGGR